MQRKTSIDAAKLGSGQLAFENFDLKVLIFLIKQFKQLFKVDVCIAYVNITIIELRITVLIVR